MKIDYEAPMAVEVSMTFDNTILAGSITLGLSSGEDVGMESEYDPW